MDLDLLGMHKLSLLIADIKTESTITIGIPHHTSGGIRFMSGSEQRVGDDNAGYIGKYIADKLGSSLVCACNYFLDPNKNIYSDYSIAIAQSRPNYLIEIHGHGKTKTRHDVEISCGSSAKEDAAIELKLALERLIRSADQNCPENRCLSQLEIAAAFDKIHFKATKTATIQDSRWLAYHIELSPRLRVNCQTNAVPKIGYAFADLLCSAISEVCR